jgi:hypothetical protein
MSEGSRSLGWLVFDARYVPGYRGWLKIKNKNSWRYEMEREAAVNKPRQRMFV